MQRVAADLHGAAACRGNPPGMTYSRQELPILSDRKRGDPGDLVANMTDASASTFCYAVHMYVYTCAQTHSPKLDTKKF